MFWVELKAEHVMLVPFSQCLEHKFSKAIRTVNLNKCFEAVRDIQQLLQKSLTSKRHTTIHRRNA